MMGKTRVLLIEDEVNKIIVVRFGAQKNEDLPQLKDSFSAIKAPWLYDVIFDLRRFDGPLSVKYIGYLTLIWRRLSQQHTTERRMAIISTHYNLNGWLEQRLSKVPERRVFVFDDFDEGLDWIKATRT
jgi:hypothetical protein